jgi:hypothetical protein
MLQLARYMISNPLIDRLGGVPFGRYGTSRTKSSTFALTSFKLSTVYFLFKSTKGVRSASAQLHSVWTRAALPRRSTTPL